MRTIKVPAPILWEPRTGRFHANIQGSKLIAYPGVGHVPMEDLPGESSRDAAAFLAAQ